MNRNINVTHLFGSMDSIKLSSESESGKKVSYSSDGKQMCCGIKTYMLHQLLVLFQNKLQKSYQHQTQLSEETEVVR